MKKKIIGAMAAIIFSFTAGARAGSNDIIESGRKIKMHYTMEVEGKVIDSTRNRQPFEFVDGKDPIIPGLEAEMKGLKAGDHKEFTVTSENAFGSHEAAAVIRIPRKNLPEGDIKPGMTYTTKGEGARPMRGVVQTVEGDIVVLDFNHPLAGKELHFEIDIIEVV
jgi:FKBP-type peptidyl-prolyl cis-trans isomerase 2